MNLFAAGFGWSRGRRERRMSEPQTTPDDGTDRLCKALYGRPATARDFVGGSQATMLHDGATQLTALREENARLKDGHTVNIATIVDLQQRLARCRAALAEDQWFSVREVMFRILERHPLQIKSDIVLCLEQSVKEILADRRHVAGLEEDAP